VVREPADPGTHTSSTSSEGVTLGIHTVPVTLYLPDGAGPFPVVVFTHGFMLSPALYASYGDHLASWGYAVVMPELPGSMMAPTTHRELKELLRGLLDWIDAEGDNPSGPFAGRADPTRLGLAGHSMGGKISLLVATEDARPRAVFGVDPLDAAGGPFGGDPVDYPSVTPELMPAIAVPLGLLGETVNATGGTFGQACAPAEDNFQQYYQHAVSPALEIEVLGANHMSFLDNPDCGLTCSMCSAGTDDPAVTRAVTRRYLTAIFEVFVRGDAAYRPYLDGAAIAADVTAGLITTQHKNNL
jgi:dienelactone hydrolase